MKTVINEYRHRERNKCTVELNIKFFHRCYWESVIKGYRHKKRKQCTSEQSTDRKRIRWKRISPQEQTKDHGSILQYYP